jgi:hypothetical protein
MRNIIKTLFFTLLLMFVSVGYKLLVSKDTTSHDAGFLLKEARADIPVPDDSGGSCGCVDGEGDAADGGDGDGSSSCDF